MDKYINEINTMCNDLGEEDLLFIRRIYTVVLRYLEKKGKKNGFLERSEKTDHGRYFKNQIIEMLNHADERKQKRIYFFIRSYLGCENSSSIRNEG